PERTVAALTRAAEEIEKIGEHGDRTGNGCGDGHDQRVAILHMRQFMREYAGEFFLIEFFQNAGGAADRRMLRAAPRREGVGLRIRLTMEMPLGIVMRLVPPHVGSDEAAKKAAELVRRESEARKAAARGAARACGSRRAPSESAGAAEERRAKAKRDRWTERAG